MRIVAIITLFCAMAIGSVGVPAARAADDAAPQDGIETYCGIAVGEEQQEYDAKGPVPWSLKLIFADKETRAYLSDVEITVVDEEGNQVLQNLCEGAWIVMALPKGTYKVSCIYQGEPMERTIQVPGGKTKTEYFFW